ncbi:MAG: YncE family protein [Gammaproteobacteria bacterium]
MNTLSRARAGIGRAACLFVLLAFSASGAAARAPGYEVWIIDQSDTRGLDHGGTLHIFGGDQFARGGIPAPAAATVVDLGGAGAALCRERTGANPVRPHMVLFDATGSHAVIAFVASGHVLVMDAATRNPVECIRTTKSPTGQQAHAAFPAPDGSYVLVANQNGKRLERIDSDFARRSFVHNLEATLDLATCRTLSGKACQEQGLRPDNAPICPVISPDGSLAFVTLRGGGMLVVDPRPTPMRIVAEYDMQTVHGNGCGGLEHGGNLYVNSGGRPGPMEHLHVYGFDVYRFTLADFGGGTSSVNTPAAKVVYQVDGAHDSHGMVLTGRKGRYLWVFDRHADMIEVFATADDRHVGSIALNGALTSNAAPDISDISPAGDLVFVALRGPTPLSGDPHNARGDTPGLGVVRVGDGGRGGELSGIVRFSNVGADGVERADPHGLRVRRLR